MGYSNDKVIAGFFALLILLVVVVYAIDNYAQTHRQTQPANRSASDSSRAAALMAEIEDIRAAGDPVELKHTTYDSDDRDEAYYLFKTGVRVPAKQVSPSRWKAVYDGEIIYVRKEDIILDDDLIEVGRTVNVRADRSTSSEIVDKLSPGERATVARCENDWCGVYNAVSGLRIGYSYEPVLRRASVSSSEGSSSRSSSSSSTSRISAPSGARQTDFEPADSFNDARSYFSSNLSRSAIRSHYEQAFRARGWTPYGSQSASMIAYKKGSQVKAVVMDASGGSFVVMSGSR